MVNINEVRKLTPMGQWATDKGIAECLELNGFGIVGAVIDTEGGSIILQRALLFQDLLEVCHLMLACSPMQQGERNGAIMGMISQAIDAARDAIAKVEASCT